jgi:hypothetical protein
VELQAPYSICAKISPTDNLWEDKEGYIVNQLENHLVLAVNFPRRLVIVLERRQPFVVLRLAAL